MPRKTIRAKDTMLLRCKSIGGTFELPVISQPLLADLRRLMERPPARLELKSANPRKRSWEVTWNAALKAAAISGGLSLPPGPLGLLTAVPELLSIWQVQAQMVKDIACAFGERAPVSREKMIRCLFKSMACQLAKDTVIRAARRALLRRASRSIVRRVLWRCGLPLIGAAGAATYAWLDTLAVGKRAVALFEQEQRIPKRKKRARNNVPPRKPSSSGARAARRTPTKRKSSTTGRRPAKPSRDTRVPRLKASAK